MDQSGDRLPSKQVVLVGVGHTNAHVVRMWGMNPIPDTGLTCISDNSIATYSGMLPAVLAGQNSVPDMEIDLVRLCASVGARLIVDEVTGIDVDDQTISLANRPAVPFDALSIGIGSVPTVSGVRMDTDAVLKIKPMQTFLQRLEKSVTAAAAKREGRQLRVAIAGSGVAGIEIAFCLPPFLQKHAAEFSIRVVTRSPEILQGVIPSFRKRAMDDLAKRDVEVSTGKTVVQVTEDGLHLNDGNLVEADLVIWATGASAPPLFDQLNIDLPMDGRGFLATDATLRSTSGKPVFAVGDTGTILSDKLPKAGVYAVRQGPILWQNLRNLMASEPLIKYKPQKSFMKLLNTGDGSAIGEYNGFSFKGPWAMQLKNRIDGRFMKMYRPLEMKTSDEQMQCRGCGCKLGGDVLESVIDTIASSEASSGPIHGLDDAALIETNSGASVVASTDFFTTPFKDAYLSGRVAALHSASDLVAMGASVNAVLANVVLPEGETKVQRQEFSDVMAGARREFEAMGGAIVGGHTIEGPRFEIGFTVIGEPATVDNKRHLLCKANLNAGDVLYVTKPLGIGVLLVAHMQGRCAAADYDSLIETMLAHQQDFVKKAIDFGVKAATDVTGFGLIGHLIEMLKASKTTATLELSKIPLLNGAAVAFTDGLESTLAPGNRYVESLVEVDEIKRAYPEYKALFDPQTCGGLLLGVPEKRVAEFEEAFADSACCPDMIGRVEVSDSGRLVKIR